MKSGTILGPINSGQQPQNQNNSGRTSFGSGTILGPATPIEPVTSTPKKKKDKNIGSTIGYLGGKIATGATSVYEGTADTIAIGLKWLGKGTSFAADNPVGEFVFGKDAGDYENNPLYQLGDKMIKDDVAGMIDKKSTEAFAPSSYIKEDGIVSQVAEGVGYIAGLVKGSGMFDIGKAPKTINTSSKLLNIVIKGIQNPTTKTMFVSTIGNSYAEASNSGANDLDATLYSVLNAAKETGIEMISGGLGNKFGPGGIDELVEKTAKAVIKNKVIRYASVLGVKMGMEGLEEVAAGLLDPFVKSIYTKDLNFENYNTLGDAFIVGSLVSGVMQTPSTIVDYKNDTSNKPKEKGVVVEDPNNPIETEENSELVTLGSKITEIQNEIDGYKQQFEEAKKVNNSEDMAIYQSQITYLEQKQTKMNTKLTSMEQKTKEVENYKNTEDYKVIENISKDLGYKINIISEDVNKSGQGYIDNTNKEITVNLQSPKAVNRVFTHEITHGLETTNQYQDLKKYVFDIVSQDEMKSIKTQINKAHQKIGKQLTKEQIDSEVVAHFIEDNLLQKQDDILKLRDTNRNIFDKLYDIINDLLVKVKGTTYEKQISRVQKLYKKALNEKVTSETSKLPKKQVNSEVKKVKKPIVKPEVKKETIQHKEVKRELPKKEYPEYVKTEQDKKFFDSAERIVNSVDKEVKKETKEIKKELPKKELTDKEKKRAKLQEMYEKSKAEGKVKQIDDNKLYDTEDGQSSTTKKKDIKQEEFKNKLKATLDKKYSLAGINANMSDNQKNNLNIAKNMKKNGISADDIWYATGWEFNEADKDWRFELPDGKINIDKFNKVKNKDGITKLSEIFDAKELYQSYPELKNIKVDIFNNKRKYEGSFNPDTKLLTMYGDISLDRAHSIIVHEIQHVIQEIEGFASGGKPQDIENRYIENGLYVYDEQTQNDIRRMYRRIAGEVEARNVDRRYTMDNYLRSKNRPGITQDTEYKQQLVRPKQEGQISFKTPNVDNVNFSLELDSEGNKLSKEQQIYFKDSKVRDEQGKLLKVYHGDMFGDWTTLKQKNNNNNPLFLTSDKKAAEGYSRYDEYMGWSTEDYNKPVKRKNYSFYANIKNPSIIDAKNKHYNEIHFEGKNHDLEYIFDTMIKEGFDGLIVKNVYDSFEEYPIDVYVIKDSNQIKNIDNLNPTKNKDIRFSLDLNKDTLSEKQFYNNYGRHIINLDGKLSDDEVISKIKQEGFKGHGGFGINVLPSKLVGDAVDNRYPVKKGKTMLLVPWKYVDERNGASKIKTGWVPNDFEIVKVEYDNQPLYELYLKNKSNSTDAKYSLDLLDEGQKRKTQKAVRAEIEEETGLKYFNFNKAKNLSTIKLSGTNPLRVMEKVFGKKLGAELNERFIYPILNHSALKFRWQNQERQEIKSYGFKARSKESAAIQKIGEHGYIDFKTHKYYEYGLKDLQKEFPDNWRQIYKAAEKIKVKYNEYLKNTNEIITKYGYDPIKERKDYFMHFRELNFLFETVGLPSSVNDAILPTNINGLTGIFRPGKKFFTSQLQRRGEYTKYDAIGGIDRYIQQVGDVLFHTEDIQRLRALDGYIRNKYAVSKLDNDISHKDKQLISDKHLSSFVNWLSDYTNAIAGKQDDIDRGFERKFGRTTYKYLNAVKSQVGRNLVGLNPSSALTNFISVTQGAAKTNKIAFMKGMYKTFRNIVYDDGLMSTSTFYTNRLGSNKLSGNWFEKVSDFGQSFMQITDLTSSQIILRSKFEEFKAKGYTDEVAMKKADVFASKIIAGRTIGEMPTLFNSKLLGIFTQFQLEVNNQMDTIFRDTFTEDYAAMDNKQISNPALYNTFKAASIFAQLLAYAWLFNEGFEKVTGRRPGFDPIGVIQRAFRHYNNNNLNTEEATLKVVEEALQQIPFAELLVGGGRFPISDALPNPKALLDNTSTAKKELMKLPVLIFPTGGGQLRKTLQGSELYKYDNPGSYLKDKKTGELKLKYPVKDDTLSKAQTLIFGAYGSPEARQYYDNNWNALSIKQTKYYNKTGLPIKQYRKVITDLNKIRADKDFRGEPIKNTSTLKKYRYIERLPIKPKQKQELYEYLKKN